MAKLNHATDLPEDLESKYIKKEIQVLLYRLQSLPEPTRGRLQGDLTQTLLERTMAVDTPRGRISFVTLNRASAGRAATLLTKQPATIAWIDRFDPHGVFWDIGANVGVYSLYAALRGDTRVVAFEPAAVNYFMLAANCEINRFEDRVHCVLAGVGRSKSIACLAASQFAGAASFGFGAKKAQVYDGRQASIVLTIDQLVEEFGLPCPNYLKIDVPSLTEDILFGGARTLSRPEVREVHVEASESSSSGRRVIGALERSGLVLDCAASHGASDLTFVRPKTS
jgi:FkbM family methyltransferase